MNSDQRNKKKISYEYIFNSDHEPSIYLKPKPVM